MNDICCTHCNKPLNLAKNNWETHVHNICKDEEKRRYENGECVKCGKSPTESPYVNDGHCKKCHIYSKWKGYVGP